MKNPIWIIAGDAFEGHQGHWADCFFSNATEENIRDYVKTQWPEIELEIREMTEEEMVKYPEIELFCQAQRAEDIFAVTAPTVHDKIQRAKDLATLGHKDQARKYSNQPYIIHPIAVHDLVIKWMDASQRGKEISDELRTIMECAAFLHDLIEDCPQISEQDIITSTDESVLKLVQELTNPSKAVKAPRAVRKQMDRDHLSHISWEAKIIKLCDRICNLRDMDGCPDASFRKLYAEESKRLLECLKGTDQELEAVLNECILDLSLI